VLRPWNYWTRVGDPYPGVEILLGALESVLARDLAHPGACHLYIHAVEASRDPGRAAACADLLIDGMPGASHMRHMPSHTYMRIGRYGDAVRSNQLARVADQHAEHGGATAIYPLHNLNMLLFAASYDGQSGVAIQAARDLARLSPGTITLPLVLVRFGRWDEIMELEPPTAGVGLAIWNYARGMAHLRRNQVLAARMNLGALEAFRTAVPNFYNRQLVGLAAATLSAEIDAAAGRFDEALRSLEAARPIETDSLGYSEPEDWLVPLRQVAGAILLQAGRPADAEVAYRGQLESHPENGWSLYGLYLALQAQGRESEAEDVLNRFRRVWSRSDVHLTGSVY
jgi:tetratricopeptide (TPR) repeat protein